PTPAATTGCCPTARRCSPCSADREDERRARRDAGPAVVGLRGRQTAAMVHCRLVLESGAHSFTGAPTVLTPPLSRAVPVPRLMIWNRPLPMSLSRHCWLLPPFHED